jgi:hypothetical protein
MRFWAIRVYNTRQLVMDSRRQVPYLYASKNAAFAAIRRLGRLEGWLPVEVQVLVPNGD